MSKIVNTAFPENDDIGIESLSVTYVQNPDTNDKSEHYQYLTLSSENVPTMDNNLPYYINMSIADFEDGEKGHWSIDINSDDMNNIVSDFVERLKHEKIKQ